MTTLLMHTEIHGVFQSKLIIAFKCIRSLQEILGGYTDSQGNAFKENVLRQNRKFLSFSSTRP